MGRSRLVILSGLFLLTVSQLVSLSAVSTLPLCPALCPPAQLRAILALPRSSERLLAVELWQGWWHRDTEHVLVQGVLLVARSVKQRLHPLTETPEF